MKTFKRNSEPLEIEIEDIKGNMIRLASNVSLTPDIMDQVEAASVDLSLTTSKKVVKQLSILFGTDEKTFAKFEIPVLSEVLKYIAGEIYAKKK